MVLKGLEKRLEKLETKGRIETIQNTALLRSTRILWTEETCCHLEFTEKPLVRTDVTTSKEATSIKTIAV